MSASNSCGFTRMFTLPLTEGYETSICVRDADGKYAKYATGIFYACHEKDETYVFVVSKDDPSQVLFQYYFQPNEQVLMYASDFCAILEIPLSSAQGSIRGVLQQLESKVLRNDSSSEPGHRSLPIAKVAFQFNETLHCLSICDFYLWAAHRGKSGGNHKFIYEMSFVESLQGRQTVTEPAPLPPMPNLLNLQIVLNHFERCLYSPFTCTMLTAFISSTDYLSRLFEVFQQATNLNSPLQSTEYGHDKRALLATERFGHESATHVNPYERTQMLWTISEIVKAMIRTNRQELICRFVSAEKFSKVLMMLEYDRTFGAKKANYADFYNQSARAKLSFTVADKTLMDGIKMMFRLYLLRDIAVGWIHEPTNRFLTVFIQKAHINLVLGLTENSQFFEEIQNLFGIERQFSSIDESRIFQEPSADAKESAFILINEFITSVRLLPTESCRSFMRKLLDSGIFMAHMRYGMDIRRRKDIKLMSISSLKQVLDIEPIRIHQDLPGLLPLIVSLLSFNKGMDNETLSLIPDFCLQIDPLQAELDTRESFGQVDEHVLLVEVGAVVVKIMSIYREEAIDLLFNTVWRLNRLIGGDMSLFIFEKKKSSDSDDKAKQGSAIKVVQVATFLDVICECLKLHPKRTVVNMTRFAIWERMGLAFTTSHSILTNCTGLPSQIQQSSSNQNIGNLDRKGRFKILTHILSLLRHAVNVLGALEGEILLVLQRQLIYSKLLKQVMHHACDNDIERGVQRATFLQIMTAIAEMNESEDLHENVSLIVDYLKHKQLTLAQKTCEEYPVVKRIIYDPGDASVSALNLPDRSMLGGGINGTGTVDELDSHNSISSSSDNKNDSRGGNNNKSSTEKHSPNEPCLASAWVPKKESGTQRNDIIFREQLIAESKKSEQKRIESLTLEHRRQQELRQRHVLLSTIRAHAAQRQRLHHHLFFEQHMQQQRRAEHQAKVQRDVKERQRHQQRGEHLRELEEVRRQREQERMHNLHEVQPAYIRSLQPQRVPHKVESVLNNFSYAKFDDNGDGLNNANEGALYHPSVHQNDLEMPSERSPSPSHAYTDTLAPIVPVDPSAPAVSVPMGQSRLARQAKHARAHSYIPLPSVPRSPGLRKPFDEDDEPEPKRIRFSF